MEEKAESLPQTRFEEASTVWSGEDFLLPLKELGITAQSQQIIVVIKCFPLSLYDVQCSYVLLYITWFFYHRNFAYQTLLITFSQKCITEYFVLISFDVLSYSGTLSKYA